MMLTPKDAKSMAKSLRDVLGSRNVQLSHSDCLEIVARQFGLADWNTLAARIPAAPAGAPWGPCSFCGKKAPEVRILLGGCGGWEGFRARRNPESGERSNAFICNECTALIVRMVSGSGDIAADTPVS